MQSFIPQIPNLPSDSATFTPSPRCLADGLRGAQSSLQAVPISEARLQT